VHLNPKGLGEGKISITGKLAVDNAAKTIALENYSALPVVLKNVNPQMNIVAHACDVACGRTCRAGQASPRVGTRQAGAPAPPGRVSGA